MVVLVVLFCCFICLWLSLCLLGSACFACLVYGFSRLGCCFGGDNLCFESCLIAVMIYFDLIWVVCLVTLLFFGFVGLLVCWFVGFVYRLNYLFA